MDKKEPECKRYPKKERFLLRIQAKKFSLLRDDYVVSCLKQSSFSADILSLIVRKESEIFRATES